MKRIFKMILSIIALLAVAYFGLGIVLYFMQPSFLYAPTREVLYDPGQLGLDFEKVIFKSEDDVKLTGWYIPAKDAEFTILFCHGNGGNIVHRLDSINIFNKLGLNCFIFDYRGYGNSQGKPSEEGTYRDAAAAYNWLRREKKTPGQNIIIFGRSLGGSIGAYLAEKVEVKGLIIESGFTSYADIGQKFYPYMAVRLFASFDYSTIDYIRKVNCPVLIIHSRDDEIIPFDFGLRLYDAANEPKEFIEIFGNHNDGFLHSGEIYRQGMAKWVRFWAGYQPQSLPKLKRIS